MLLLLALVWFGCEYRSDMVRQPGGAEILQPNDQPDLEAMRLREPPLPELKVRYVSGDGRFYVRFPKEPKVSFELIPSAQGSIELHTFSHDYSSTKAYWVSYSDHPSELLESRIASAVLAEARDYVLAGLGPQTELVDEKEAGLEGYPGLVFSARNGNFHAAYTLYLVENRLYQIGILRDGEFPSGPDLEAFTESFGLIPEG